MGVRAGMEAASPPKSRLFESVARRSGQSAISSPADDDTEMATNARFQSPSGNAKLPYRVEAETQSAANRQAVDKSNIVADVVIRGNKVLATHQILRHISTRPGRYFDPDQLQEDVDKLWRIPEIRRINGPYINRTEDGVIITIEVVERVQMTEVDFIGNRGITDRALRKETGLADGQPLDVNEIRMAKSRIEEYYKQKGYPKTQVEIMEGTEEGDQQVVFLINEDQKQRIWKAEFEGNEFATDARLRHFIESKPGILKVFGGLAKRDEIEQDIKRLDIYYKKFGFFNVRIGREVNESNDGRWLTLRFIIDEGPRYRVRNVSFIGNSAFETDQLTKLIELKPGEGEAPEFNAAKMNQDVVALRDLYGSQGYVYSEVEAEPRFLEKPGLMDIVYKVSEGEQYRVGRINIHIEGGEGITKREVPLNRISLRPGELIDLREIRNSERRLGSAQIFAGGEPGSQGQAPRIVVRPPDLTEIERTAQLPRTGGSQSTGPGNRY